MNPHQPEVHIRQERMPGRGYLFHLPVREDATITVVVDRHSRARELDVLVGDADEPTVSLRLEEPEAVTLATLLSGIHVVFESEPEDMPADAAHVETVVIGSGSPAVGVTTAELDIPDPDQARVLAVIRDDTPDLLEDDRARPCRPGDRLVIAGRPSELRRLRRFLAG